jgi:sugar O-acyltransferase (sialic acid O-acetyltransferase NeuD family)
MQIDIEGFALDDESYSGYINSIPIVCGTKEAKAYAAKNKNVKIVYSLYRPDLMEERIQLFNSYNIPEELMYTFVHPSAVVSKSATIGIGSVILAQTVINPNAFIGKCCTINSGCLIGHDSKIGAYNYIAGHVCVGSNLNIGDGNFIGLNTSIRNFLKIGDYNIIGMASNIVKNVENSKVLMGNPAKEVEKLNNIIR